MIFNSVNFCTTPILAKVVNIRRLAPSADDRRKRVSRDQKLDIVILE
jgi:hypothetical protein